MIETFHRIKWLILWILLQVLILNRLHIVGYATPFLYIYFILTLDSRCGRNSLMLWAFSLGLTVDAFTNTPGMNAASATLMAFSRNSILRMVTLRDMSEGFRPGIKSLGFFPFFRYGLLASGLFCTMLWMIDTFSLGNILHLLLKIVTSTVSTVFCIIAVELMEKR